MIEFQKKPKMPSAWDIIQNKLNPLSKSPKQKHKGLCEVQGERIPTGMQIMCKAFDDEKMLRIARAVEKMNS